MISSDVAFDGTVYETDKLWLRKIMINTGNILVRILIK